MSLGGFISKKFQERKIWSWMPYLKEMDNVICIIKGGLIEKIKIVYDTYSYFNTPFYALFERKNFQKNCADM